MRARYFTGAPRNKNIIEREKERPRVSPRVGPTQQKSRAKITLATLPILEKYYAVDCK